MVIELLAQSSTDQSVSEALGVLQTVLEYAGTVAFALSGALLAARKQMDLVGLVVLASIVAVGGGTVRDLVLNLEVSWVDEPTFILVAVGTALLAIPLFRTGTFQALKKYNLVGLTDAAGMALFVITGTNVALEAGASNLSAAIIGVITGVGGGVIRDVLANQIPDVLKSGQYYATAAFAGAVLYLLLLELPVSPALIMWIPLLAIFGIRVLSLRFGWGIPSFDIAEEEQPF